MSTSVRQDHMRQGNQNRRGRGNRPRKNSNPSTRNYESNGPDVKIRGSAAHIAGKYASLARDARATGDPVSSENYWQHAEHYNRIVQSAESQTQEKRQNAGAQSNGGQRRQPHEGHAQAPEGQQKNLANGNANGAAPGQASTAPAQTSQEAAEDGAQDRGSTDEGNEPAVTVKRDAPARKEAVAKPVRKRAKPGPKASAKPATATKTEAAPTEEAG